MRLTNFSKTVGLLTVLFGLLVQPVAAQTAASAGKFAGNFAEVQITLNDEVTLADISALPRAPGGGLEVLDDGERVRVQLPADSVQALVEEGAEVAVLRSFVLVEADAGQNSTSDGDVASLTGCSGDYYYGESDANAYIEDRYNWWGSGLNFSGVPGTPVVTCIDVHYEVVDLSWSSIVDVALSEADYDMYTLVSGWWGYEGDIIQTRTGITYFNGEAVGQVWILFAWDLAADGNGYIDYWWIKLYYVEEQPEYCEASGNCDWEYVDDVIVGAINNTNNGCTTGYSDYTSMSTTMQIGTGCAITVVSGNPNLDGYDECGIWVDWNQDVDFYDSNEAILVNGTPGIGPYTATITPPAGADLGDTGMRIRLVWAYSPSPCGTTEDGEVEDYTITVVPESSLPADIIAPAGVNFRDFAILAGQWQQAPGQPSADIAPACPDGIVDELDLKELAENWLAGF